LHPFAVWTGCGYIEQVGGFPGFFPLFVTPFCGAAALCSPGAWFNVLASRNFHSLGTPLAKQCLTSLPPPCPTPCQRSSFCSDAIQQSWIRVVPMTDFPPVWVRFAFFFLLSPLLPPCAFYLSRWAASYASFLPTFFEVPHLRDSSKALSWASSWILFLPNYLVEQTPGFPVNPFPVFRVFFLFLPPSPRVPHPIQRATVFNLIGA